MELFTYMISFLLQYFEDVQIVTQDPKELCMKNASVNKKEFKARNESSIQPPLMHYTAQNIWFFYFF